MTTFVNNNHNDPNDNTIIVSHKKDVERLKFSLKLIFCTLLLFLLSELLFTQYNSIETTLLVALGIISFLYLWVNEDTIQVINGIVLWGSCVLIFSIAWENYGIYDSSLAAYPCVILLGIIMGSRILFIPLIVAIFLQLLILFFAHQYKIITPAETLVFSHKMKAIDLAIIFFLFCYIAHFFIKNYEKKLTSLHAEKAQYIAKLKESQALLHKDPLTKLPNEHICFKEIKPFIAEAKSKLTPLSFMVLDIINLRQINSSFGHNIGDLLILNIANRLSSFLQEQEYLYRINGNEFILVKIASETKELDVFKERCVQAMTHEFNIAGYDITAQCSLGIAIAPFDGDNIELLHKNAHLALQHGKDKQKNSVQYFEPNIKAQIDSKFFLISAIKAAIKNDEFKVFYQPKFNLHTNKMVGVEALIRWHHETQGWIAPDTFIPVAEETGLIVDITKMVIQQACFDAATWHKLGYSDISVAINLSAADFKRGNLPLIIFSTLKQTGLSPHLLELEITESTIFEDIAHIQSQIRQLQQKGISFAIDDFGTGYSNLGYLNKFNVSVLKIDRTFVNKVATANHEQHIINAIITMSKSLEITNVAEGIENQATIEWLKASGCQIGQGFYFEKPLPLNELIERLKNEA